MSEPTQPFKIDWAKYPKLATMFERRPAVNVYAADLVQLIVDARADAVRFVKDVKAEELVDARGRGWDAAIAAVLEGATKAAAGHDELDEKEPNYRSNNTPDWIKARAIRRFIEVYVEPLVSAQAKAAKASSSEP